MKSCLKVTLLLLLAVILFSGCATSPHDPAEDPGMPKVSGMRRQNNPLPEEDSIKDEAVWGYKEEPIFHRPECPKLLGVSESDKIKFRSLYLALDANYHPCKNCQPEKWDEENR